MGYTISDNRRRIRSLALESMRWIQTRAIKSFESHMAARCSLEELVTLLR